MEKITKQLIKEAILEALVEFTNGGIATASEGDGETVGNTGNKDPETGEGEGTPEGGEDGKKKDPIEPDPIWPPAGFSLRRK